MNEVFLNEARDLLEQLEAALLDLEKRPTDRELINTTFRALHTLKGSGGMFGPPAMAAFAHELENAFEKVRQDIAPVTPALVSLLLRSADQLRKLLFDADGDHHGESARLAAALVAEVAGEPASAGSATAIPAAAAAAPAASMTHWRIALRLEKNALAFGTNPLALLDELRGLGRVDLAADLSAVPALEDLVPTELHIGWTIDLHTDAPRSAIDDVFIFVDGPEAVRIERVETATAANEAAPAARPPPRRPTSVSSPGPRSRRRPPPPRRVATSAPRRMCASPPAGSTRFSTRWANW